MMIKLNPIWKHKPGTAVGDCQDYNRFGHGRLTTVTPEFNRFQCKYVLSSTLAVDHPGFAAPDEWAGVAEDWFYSIEALNFAFALPVYARFREDEQRFADLDELILMPAVPTLLLGTGIDAPYKVFRIGWFRADADAGAARKRWEVDYARAIAHDRALKAVLSGYVQNRPVALAHSFPPSVRSADLLDEFWFDDLDALPEFLAREAEVRGAVGQDEMVDGERQIQLATQSKLLWELGEDPSAALPRLSREPRRP